MNSIDFPVPEYIGTSGIDNNDKNSSSNNNNNNNKSSTLTRSDVVQHTRGKQ